MTVNEVDPVTRIEIYIRNVEQVLEQIKELSVADSSVREIISIAEAYVKDARFYLSRGDYLTALSTIAYAEGLLDALRLLGYVRFTWKMPSELLNRARTKVLTAGTFEIIHPGHIYYLKEAWKLGRVITIIARDSTVRKIKKRDVIIGEEQRLEVVSSLYYVHKARLGYEDDILKVVEEERPDIILLGPDQPFDEDKILSELKRRGLDTIQVKRLNKRIEGELYSTTNIIRKILEKFSNMLEKT